MNALPSSPANCATGLRGAADTRVAVAVLAGLLALGAGGWWLAARVPAARNAQHFLLIITDTTRRDSFGCYGADRPVTPNMDAVTADGVRFEQAVAQSCWTLPTVTSILTSTYPTVHGAVGKGMVFRRCREEIPQGQEILRGHGFVTHAIVNAAFLGPELGTKRGFDSFDYVAGRNWEARRADESVDSAIRFFEENRGRNTLCMLHLFDPHLNYDAPGEFREKFTGGYSGPFTTITATQIVELVMGRLVPERPEREYLLGRHLGEVAFMDQQIGRLIEALKGMGLYERMTIVIVSDHGEEFWDHDGFEHGHSMYQELIHLPLIVKPPSRIVPAGSVVSARVRQIDIMPTIFELAGIEPPDTFAGQSLVPLMSGSGAPVDRGAYSEGTLYGPDKLALYRDRYKYIFDTSSGSGELYDVEADPRESVNLISRLPAAAAELREEMADICEELSGVAAGLSSSQTVDMSLEQHSRTREELQAIGYLVRDETGSDESRIEAPRCPVRDGSDSP